MQEGLHSSHPHTERKADAGAHVAEEMSQESGKRKIEDTHPSPVEPRGRAKEEAHGVEEAEGPPHKKKRSHKVWQLLKKYRYNPDGERGHGEIQNTVELFYERDDALREAIRWMIRQCKTEISHYDLEFEDDDEEEQYMHECEAEIRSLEETESIKDVYERYKAVEDICLDAWSRKEDYIGDSCVWRCSTSLCAIKIQ